MRLMGSQIEIMVWTFAAWSWLTVDAGSGYRLGSMSCEPQTYGLQYCQSWTMTSTGMLLFR